MKIILLIIGVLFVIEAIFAIAWGEVLQFFVIGGIGICMIFFSGGYQVVKKEVDKKIDIIKDTEEGIYKQISDEIENDEIDKSLWTMAEAKSDGGDDKKIKSIYIKLRYKKLTKSI